MKDREIEIKVRVENGQALVDFLVREGEFQGKRRQIDTYYCPPHRDFLAVKPIKEWLRLRKSDNQCSINYKNWHYEADGMSHYCDEYETPVEDLKTLEKILATLDFRVITVVDKVRTTWKYKDYEIAIDAVNDLGNFVEIEYTGDSLAALPAKITAEMLEWLRGLGVRKIERCKIGYPAMLLSGEEMEVAGN